MTAPIAVIDVETTGVNPYRHDRIIELAAVVTVPGKGVIRQFESLINPDRDIGPTSIHGLTASDVRNAPTFADIAAEFVRCVRGCTVVGGHNVRFDYMFISNEFSRLGHPLDDVRTICSMQLAGGGTLAQCCEDYGLSPPSQAHSALADASATAQLLLTLLADEPELLHQLSDSQPIRWPEIEYGAVEPLTRSQVKAATNRRPDYLDTLLSAACRSAPRNLGSGTQESYWGLLDRVLEDRIVVPTEGQQLIELARNWGLSPAEIVMLHDGYLESLVTAAKADGLVTDAKRRDLERVAHLLGVPSAHLKELLERCTSESSGGPTCESTGSTPGSLVGQTVCFTGECQCTYEGRPITRDRAEALVNEHGLVFSGSVTKKLDILVVADPDSLSGKAKKARKYGIRIVHEPVFWKMLGVGIG